LDVLIKLLWQDSNHVPPAALSASGSKGIISAPYLEHP